MSDQSLENPVLNEAIENNSELKNLFVNYIGQKLNPEDGKVTVQMIIEVMAEEFPEFLLAVAEENFIRGYEQAMADISAEIEASDKTEKSE